MNSIPDGQNSSKAFQRIPSDLHPAQSETDPSSHTPVLSGASGIAVITRIEMLQRMSLSEEEFDSYVKASLEASDNNWMECKKKFQRQDPMWHFVKSMWSAAMEVEVDLETIFDAVCGSLENLGLEWADHFENYGEEDAYAGFERIWPKIKFAHGEGRYDRALRLANGIQIQSARAKAKPKRYATYDLFLTVAAYLQIGEGQKMILLPVERLGRLLCVTPSTISDYRRLAIEDGYLRPTRGYSKRMATEFVFDLSKCPELQI